MTAWVMLVVSACGSDATDEASDLCGAVQTQIDGLDAPVDLVEFGGRADTVSDLVSELSGELGALDVDSDDADGFDQVTVRLDEVAEALSRAQRAAALGNVEGARSAWEEADDWGDTSAVADDLGMSACVLDLTAIEPPDGSAPPVTAPPVTDPPATDPPDTEPPDTEPPDTGPAEAYPFTVFDPTSTLLVPDGHEWFPFEEADHREFFDAVNRSSYADQLTGLTVGDVQETASGDFVMLAREFFWLDVVVGTEITTSLDDVYLDDVVSSSALTLGGIEGQLYTDEDGTSGWIGHQDRYSIVLQFPVGVDPSGIGDAYVALNY
jgi:hypothetical protein